MLSLRYGRQFRLALATVPLLLVLLTLALDRHPTMGTNLDTCYIRRELEKPAPTFIPMRDGPLHNYSVLVMWISMFLLALLPNGRLKAVYLLTYTSIWFHITYILLAALKAPLYDFACAGRHQFFPNGISGHYCYFIFVALTTPRFARTRLRLNPNTSRLYLAPIALLLTLFTVGGTATLYRTFFHGYHSPRQIALGAALGIFSHSVLDFFQFEDDAEPPITVSLSVLFASSLNALTSYYFLWPHVIAGAAITAGHLRFHAALWLVLLAAAYLRQSADRKVATD
ncbi:unnamed protein product [Chondrus crispus]|uniref:Phosphatidic acid phosphatase type 2/haloperoxidase domain-containing protein n=1 Tax=Chondrus crispus TaxID=2769 RepID=R7QBL7_CHOCR|nr:unnamed protein product [Chondrus crispus]CDF35449.1 unnamed protein product [Chondrus crispus]|eukprot:XP_005715268.1 unnamed protein product [Chondrus crispus]